MASSELSSSDILGDSQPEYAGDYDPAMAPDLAAAREQISLVDEGMWKRYSSHYEFPLSMLLSLAIHVLVTLVVLAVMTISFYFGKPPNCKLETIVVEGNGPNPNRPAGGGRQQGENGPTEIEALAPRPDEVLERPPLVQPVLPSPFDRLDKTPRPGDPTARGKKSGKGVGTGEGDGIGPGDGGVPFGRNVRWRINLRYDEPEAFITQLNNLQVIVAAKLNSGRFLVFKELPASGPVRYEEMTLDECAKYVRQAGRLGFHTQDATTAENFAYGVRLSERVLDMWIYIPKDLENALAEAEAKHYQLSEEQIRNRRLLTTFEVRRDGQRWLVRVSKTEVAKPTN